MPAPSIAISFDAELTPFINAQGSPYLPQTQRAGKGCSVFRPAMATTFSDTPLPGDGVAMPAEARSAYVFIKNGGIRARTDAADPSPTLGLYIPPGTLLQFRGQRQTMEQFRFIDSAGETAEVSAMWFV